MKITFLGGGNMATALIGMLERGFAAADIQVVELGEAARRARAALRRACGRILRRRGARLRRPRARGEAAADEGRAGADRRPPRRPARHQHRRRPAPGRPRALAGGAGRPCPPGALMPNPALIGAGVSACTPTRRWTPPAADRRAHPGRGRQHRVGGHRSADGRGHRDLGQRPGLRLPLHRGRSSPPGAAVGFDEAGRAGWRSTPCSARRSWRRARKTPPPCCARRSPQGRHHRGCARQPGGGRLARRTRRRGCSRPKRAGAARRRTRQD